MKSPNCPTCKTEYVIKDFHGLKKYRLEAKNRRPNGPKFYWRLPCMTLQCECGIFELEASEILPLDVKDPA